ncbi:bifunctional 23S rRNA (guanine(2069)-N(7))-methyltransferase RlmK/23S rRNA (guanine(2445)-N(2))-methyltransferase RlmL [Shewanella avicenniae]|uniref:Ribosomal RNA large subunit methyltransferase K/L n=1 Tax=Shewanella avicenniae TaxID=2814294 RepID=A0ABX7QUQ0_9GAMM|nr:bifunctional 23S rRNA (guanine(2069)-N(7))-methyltransferase RlmK/23S rRNA (guanine(2445)-N(2))-methyltransferase RlmL [Shewanella avicenniae]QSX35169.1 bifunctional 23S rRNA (guanine(2069)-N(7))-methyltransferase RlmK/23S rRNA (guanine(2445)-N(2))-methyltransferase RlmL [Shewanella avicenniae]
MLNCFAAAPKGFEYTLATELTELGAVDVKESVAGVFFNASQETLYRVLLWSRLASRITVVLYQGACDNADQLYNAAYAIDWPAEFDNRATFSIDFHGMGGFINNTQFGALKIKDAVVDRFRNAGLNRPNVERTNADIRIDAHYRHGQLTISLNLSGAPLHQRGYRHGTGEAPLKENLAANMLVRAQWDKTSTVFDPFCGSGTILIEAALMACDVAPGLLRPRYGFEQWRRHDQASWTELLNDAKARAFVGKKHCQVKFFGSDIDSRMVALAKRNAANAGVDHLIQFNAANVLSAAVPAESGLLISNPPYGERLGNVSTLLQLYFQWGELLKQQFGGWRVALLCSEIELLSALKLKADRQLKMFNGPLECAFNLYTLHAKSTRRQQDALTEGQELSEFAASFVNRIKKNLKQLEKWAAKEGIDSYRLYDADIPEYNVAIDRYLDFLVIQEYAAPATIPEQVTRRRLSDVLLSLPSATGVDPERIILKTREKQKGRNQYQKLDSEKLELTTVEYGAKFKLNLSDYLDTGLFLDHRLIRKFVGEKSKDRDVLNLFAYTGTASVHAALGGAKSVTTVDMSNTYLNWAKDNFMLNGLMGRQYHFEQGDCLQWIQDCSLRFDLIFIDPPTFSNSKRMEDSFDVQRDHGAMLTALAGLLNPGGEIVFSNNKRKFKIDEQALTAAGLSIQNLDDRMLPLDFKRNPHIHNTWLLSSNNK